MAKKCSIEKNNRRIMIVSKYKSQRKELTDIVKNPLIDMEKKLLAQKKLANMPRDASAVRIRNRCALTGRSRGYMGFFKLSRMKFREMALLGLLPGVRKASW